MTTWLVFRDEAHFRESVNTLAATDRDDLFPLAIARLRNDAMPRLERPRYVVSELAASNAVQVRRRHLRIGAA